MPKEVRKRRRPGYRIPRERYAWAVAGRSQARRLLELLLPRPRRARG